MKANRTVRTSVRTQWMALGGALVVLAGVMVAWALARAADRVQVVQMAQDVRAGEVIETDDLVLAAVAHDGSAAALVLAADVGAAVGKVAAIDLQPGVLLQHGMWREVPTLRPGEQRVGVVLKPGRFPADLSQGDLAWAAALDPVDPTVAGDAPQPVPVRVLAASLTPDGTSAFTLAVPGGSAVVVARSGAVEQLVLVGEGVAAAVDGGEGR